MEMVYGKQNAGAKTTDNLCASEQPYYPRTQASSLPGSEGSTMQKLGW